MVYDGYEVEGTWYDTFMTHDFMPSVKGKDEWLIKNTSTIHVECSEAKNEYLKAKSGHFHIEFADIIDIRQKIMNGTVFDLHSYSDKKENTEILIFSIFIYKDNKRRKIVLKTLDFNKFEVVTAF